MQNLREKVLTKQTEFEARSSQCSSGRWPSDGREAGREIVLHNGAAAVVPVDKQNRVTLVRQHRVAIDQVTLEIPAGKLDDPKEDPFLCAKRELEEETGLLAGKWQKMAHVVTTPGFCTERIALYLATDLTQAKEHTYPDEILSLVKMPLTEAIMMVEKGQIVDAKTCLGLLLAQQILNQPAFLWQDNMTQMKPGMKDYYPKADGC